MNFLGQGFSKLTTFSK